MLHFTPYAEDWAKLPVIVSGEGCYVTDDRGNKYLDGLAGLFTTQVGNGRSELADAAAAQMKELGFFPNWSMQHPRSLELAAKISEIAPGDLDSTFFVSSGSEAVESVIKLARQYHKANGEAERHKFITRKAAGRLSWHYDGCPLSDWCPRLQGPIRAVTRWFSSRS